MLSEIKRSCTGSATSAGHFWVFVPRTWQVPSSLWRALRVAPKMTRELQHPCAANLKKNRALMWYLDLLELLTTEKKIKGLSSHFNCYTLLGRAVLASQEGL